MAKNLLLFAMFIGVTSCQFKKNEVDEVREPRAFKSTGFRAITSPENEFGFYSVLLEWQDLGACSPIIHKRLKNEGGTEVINLALGDVSYIDHRVPHSSAISYSLSCAENELIHAISTVNVQVIRDWSVDKDTTINAENFKKGTLPFSRDDKGRFSISLGRLRLAEQARLFVENSVVSIEAVALEMEKDSLIGTFPRGLVASPGIDGRSGGVIKLNVGSVKGSLAISLVGEGGGSGSAGAPYAAGEVTFPRGRNGKDGEYAFIKAPRCPREAECADTDGYVCISEPTPGEVGAKGLKGRDGQKGANGGNTGTAFIKIREYPFDVRIFKEKGEAGKGGLGAPGSAGGAGGAPGKTRPANVPKAEIAKHCKEAKGPVSGSAGPRGSNGENGEPGNIEDAKVWSVDRDDWEIR